MLILVILLRVEVTLCAKGEGTLLPVNVSEITLVTRMLPVALSVPQMQSASQTKYAKDCTTWTPVQMLDVVSRHSVKLLTIFRTVYVCLGTLEIHSRPVADRQGVSFLQGLYELTIIGKILAVEPVYVDPCDPNPCGPNSNPPRVIGERCQCSCLPEMIGSPPNCRPECVVNSDCSSDKACINRKCQDPCPSLCGINAYCSVRNHVVCSYLVIYTL